MVGKRANKSGPEGKAQKAGVNSARCRAGSVDVVIGFAGAKSL